MNTGFSRGRRARIAWGVTPLSLAAFMLSCVSVTYLVPRVALADLEGGSPVQSRLSGPTVVFGHREPAGQLPRSIAADRFAPVASLASIGSAATSLPVEGSMAVVQMGSLAEPLREDTAETVEQAQRMLASVPRRCSLRAVRLASDEAVHLLQPMGDFLDGGVDLEATFDGWLRRAGMDRAAPTRPACASEDPAGQRSLAQVAPPAPRSF